MVVGKIKGDSSCKIIFYGNSPYILRCVVWVIHENFELWLSKLLIILCSMTFITGKVFKNWAHSVATSFYPVAFTIQFSGNVCINVACTIHYGYDVMLGFFFFLVAYLVVVHSSQVKKTKSVSIYLLFFLWLSCVKCVIHFTSCISG